MYGGEVTKDASWTGHKPDVGQLPNYVKQFITKRRDYFWVINSHAKHSL